MRNNKSNLSGLILYYTISGFQVHIYIIFLVDVSFSLSGCKSRLSNPIFMKNVACLGSD